MRELIKADGCALALRLKAEAGSALAIDRDPKVADKAGAERGYGRSLGGVCHFGKRGFALSILAA